MDNIRSGLLPALGRLLMAAIFIQAGFGKLTNPTGTIGYIASHGMPVPQVSYVLATAVELGGGLLILVGFRSRAVASLMALFCVVTAAVFHYVPGDANMMIHFMKNVCMAGGFLQIASFGAGAWSLDAMLSRRRLPGGRAMPA